MASHLDDPAVRLIATMAAQIAAGFVARLTAAEFEAEAVTKIPRAAAAMAIAIVDEAARLVQDHDWPR